MFSFILYRMEEFKNERESNGQQNQNDRDSGKNEWGEAARRVREERRVRRSPPTRCVLGVLCAIFILFYFIFYIFFIEIAHMTGQELDPVLGIDGGPDLVLRIEDGLVPGIGEGPDLVPRIEEGPDPAPKIGILVSEIERDLGLDLVLKTGIEIATVEDLDQEIGEGPDRGIGVQDLVPGKSGILILMTGKEGIDQEVGGVILKNA